MLQASNETIYQGDWQTVSLIFSNFNLLKKIILVLFAAITLVGCTSQNEREVVLFNDITFELKDGEEIISIDSQTKEYFHSYFENTDVQVPLFRCIKAGDYIIYLGIPIRAGIDRLIDLRQETINNYTAFESDSLSYFYISHQRDMDYITEYSEAFENNFIYVLAVSNSGELSDSLFNRKEISQRLGQ